MSRYTMGRKLVLPELSFFGFFPKMAMICIILTGCAASLPERPTDGRHISPSAPAPVTEQASIPDIVPPPPPLTRPEPEPELELYTVVVHDVPVRELLFALARDAAINVDIHPEVTGSVTLNAVNQTLPRILTRLARQVDLRWHYDPPDLVITPDMPYLKIYEIDYVNISRSSSGTVSVATSIATTGTGAGGGGNDSTTVLEQNSNNLFWETLLANIAAIIGLDSPGSTEAAPGGSATRGSTMIGNPESGVIAVRTTAARHDEISHFLDHVLSRSLKQVLIEATIVEVTLSNQYQTGVDWTLISERLGVGVNPFAGQTGKFYGFGQGLVGANLAAPPVMAMTFEHVTGRSALSATIRMLEQFGDLKVLSTPRVMALNNQTAILKVVDNSVYFTIGVDITPATDDSPRTVEYTTNVHTVPVGFVMAVTPQIGRNDEITLNVRPTISRILRYLNDPNPALANANVVSRIPEIQVREVESILKVGSGQVAVLGGLMQDSIQNNRAGVPGLSRLPLLGNLFSYRDDTSTKTELIIFLRPVVIERPDLDGDFRRFRNLLPERPEPSRFFQETSSREGRQ